MQPTKTTDDNKELAQPIENNQTESQKIAEDKVVIKLQKPFDMNIFRDSSSLEENKLLIRIFTITWIIAALALLTLAATYISHGKISTNIQKPIPTVLPTAIPTSTPAPQQNQAIAKGDDLYKSYVVSDGIRKAYLTFDDGPSQNVTPIVLDILKENNIKANFFLTGDNVKKNPQIAQREYSEGHIIGNHSFTHKYSTFYSDVNSFENEINETDNALKETLGSTYNIKLFRFPGGSFGKKMIPFKEKIVEMGYKYVDWNCLTWDESSKDSSSESIQSTINRTANEHEDLIILMHDAPAKMVTAEVLPSLIKSLKDLGFIFDVITP